MEKNPLIDTVRGLAILLVVAGHVIQRTIIAQGGDFYLNPVFKVIYTFHMPLFFFISGYLLHLSLTRKSLSQVFQSRMSSLLVPLTVWGALGLLTGYILKLPIEPALWFIWFLFTLWLCGALVVLSVWLSQKLGPLAFVAVYAALLFIPFNPYLYYTQWFYVFYLAGFGCSKVNITPSTASDRASVLAVLVLLFVIFASQWTKPDYVYMHQMQVTSWDDAIRMLYRYVTGFLGIALAFSAGAYCLRFKAHTWLVAAGIFSLDIYLIQRYIVEGLFPKLVAQTGIVHMDLNGPLFLAVIVPVTAAVLTVVCMGISKILIRPHPLLNQYLLGGRK